MSAKERIKRLAVIAWRYRWKYRYNRIRVFIEYQLRTPDLEIAHDADIMRRGIRDAIKKWSENEN
jgi:hypothetical protein